MPEAKNEEEISAEEEEGVEEIEREFSPQLSPPLMGYTQEPVEVQNGHPYEQGVADGAAAWAMLSDDVPSNQRMAQGSWNSNLVDGSANNLTPDYCLDDPNEIPDLRPDPMPYGLKDQQLGNESQFNVSSTVTGGTFVIPRRPWGGSRMHRYHPYNPEYSLQRDAASQISDQVPAGMSEAKKRSRGSVSYAYEYSATLRGTVGCQLKGKVRSSRKKHFDDIYNEILDIMESSNRFLIAENNKTNDHLQTNDWGFLDFKYEEVGAESSKSITNSPITLESRRRLLDLLDSCKDLEKTAPRKSRRATTSTSNVYQMSDAQSGLDVSQWLTDTAATAGPPEEVGSILSSGPANIGGSDIHTREDAPDDPAVTEA
ncbi:uncharacterized protein I206_101356 [Kwoniella pini CBS 10737]|uniref:Uncharacterized protein n=1 Tax=Kwoniella pini CBS 10737 TaxID=1296096 RepID=A0A1B9HWX1_9TREE|nr:uncharacterized protein I206_06675 [Kwoniella pini CBS 10737]OCF47768.1 hypothetical protein I206_06675 [Kwoniella pini CBS 10737]